MPLKVAEAWVMVTIHKLLVAIGMSDGPGPAWVLSIVGLTVAVRVLIMPLFVKQIRSSRGMQAMQPELRALQNKYKGKKDPASQERMREEMMALYRKHGTNPLSSCLPMLIQIPIFFALFRVLARLQEIANSAGSAHPVKIGPLTPALAADVQASSLFGAPLSSSFMNGSSATVKIVTMVLIVLMTATQFYTMHQLTMKNMPKSVTESDNPAMRSQRMMMYGMPLIFFITGPQFQVGVLIYWLVSNVWTMGQQWWTIRNMPAVGSEAYKKRQERRRRKGLPPDDEKKSAAGSEDEAASSGPGQRVQPVRNNRKKKKNRTASTAEQRYAERARERQQAFDASGAKDGDAKDTGGAASAKSGNKPGGSKKKKGSKGGNSAKK
jgi:membrane protein insertase, yidC/oxa1 family